MSKSTKTDVLGYIIISFGIFLIIFSLIHQSGNPNCSLELFAGFAFIIVGAMIVCGLLVKSIKSGPIDIDFISIEETESPTVTPLTRSERHKRTEYVEKITEIKARSIPGSDAPPFKILEDSEALRSMPRADVLIPMYMLDKNFRILDWNGAFNLAFDHSMVGMRGTTVLEWVYLLENYQEVIDHGLEVFSGKELPVFDIETIKFKSRKYGLITGTKRAFQMPGDDGKCSGWLITIEPSFAEPKMKYVFWQDLFAFLRKTLIWSEYALSYNNVLNNTDVYPKLLSTILGETGEISSIATDARVLDLGAGTGNISRRLIEGHQRLVVAMENNPIMLSFLRYQCEDYICYDDRGSGVMIIKQDISSLAGIPDNYFDVVIMNNVLYSLDENDAMACLVEAYRVLKPGGEARISGPQKKTNLNKLFKQIKKELKNKGRFSPQMEKHYNHVKMLNEYFLAPMLYKWSIDDVKQMATDAGFQKICYSTDRAYAGQAMIVCACK